MHNPQILALIILAVAGLQTFTLIRAAQDRPRTLAVRDCDAGKTNLNAIGATSFCARRMVSGSKGPIARTHACAVPRSAEGGLKQKERAPGGRGSFTGFAATGLTSRQAALYGDLV